MKTRQFRKAILTIVIPIIYFIVVTGLNNHEILERAASITDIPTAKDFINLIFTDTYFGRSDLNDPMAMENNISSIKDSLHFNSIHIYGYDSSGGGINSNLSWYSGYVSRLMDSVKNAGLKGFWGRSKIERLSYGQRLIYEAEGGNDGFSYQTNTGSITTDSGRTVVRGCINQQCPETDATPRYLCRNIYENLQHGDLIDFTQLDDSTWFIKPVMRIDSNIVDSNPEDSVVRIDVINYSGNVIKSIKIKARNFAKKVNDTTYLYSGNYINVFDFIDEPLGTNLTVKGATYDTSGTGLNYGMRSNPWSKWKDSCKVDFKVWWYGTVDVWFDKMVLDDVWGNNLFNNDTTVRHQYENKIIEEVAEFTDNIGEGSFFIDELTHSQIPCVKRVYELMKQENPAAKLNFAVTNYFNIRSYKDNNIGNRVLLDSLQTESFSVDAHEISDVLPNTLNQSLIDPQINPDWIQSYSEYTRFLQKRVFGDKSRETGIDTVEQSYLYGWDPEKPSNWGSLVYQIELARNQRDLYSPNKRFIMQPQIQGVLKLDTTGYYKGGVREPLNEEIEAQAMLSIAHGADGICWFVYYGQPTNFKSGNYYIYGLQNHDSINNFPYRHKNMYGQDKYKAVKLMNLKIEHWKPVLDLIQWQNGWSVHKDGANHNYISDIKSIYRDPQNPISFPIENDDQTKYWEMGFFDPDFENQVVSSNDKSKYFIMVNRRCVPDDNEDGDLRHLKIKFDSTQLIDFRNWKIIELDSNKVIRTFDKNSNNYVDMGIFQPGEGKLCKLAPVMQEGGTLVADESINGVTFDCNGDVDNNGMDISIYVGTNISFENDVKWNVEGGDFKCGLYPESPNELKVNMKSQTSAFWSGINFVGCGEINIANTIFEVCNS